MEKFPFKDCEYTTVTFSKCIYAQLSNQPFEMPVDFFSSNNNNNNNSNNNNNNNSSNNNNNNNKYIERGIKIVRF